MIDLSIAGSGDEAEPADGKTAHGLPANGCSPAYSQAEAGGDYNQRRVGPGSLTPSRSQIRT